MSGIKNILKVATKIGGINKDIAETEEQKTEEKAPHHPLPLLL
jgi:phage-related tail protein